MTAEVVILGSINVDLIVSTARLPMAGETVSGEAIEYQLGGKGANQAVGAARAGAPTRFLGCVGEDEDGGAMLARLRGYGIDITAVRHVPGRTGFAIVATCPSDNQIIVVPGANCQVDEALVGDARIAEGDVCLAQRETPLAATQRFFMTARSVGATTLLNAAPADKAVHALLPLVDILIANESECRLLAALPLADPGNDTDLMAMRSGIGLAPDQVLIATLGAAGVAITRADGIHRIEGECVDVLDTTGAGDCFCGYLAAGLAQGISLETATVRANIAASLAVQSRGAASSVPQDATVAAILGARRRLNGREYSKV